MVFEQHVCIIAFFDFVFACYFSYSQTLGQIITIAVDSYKRFVYYMRQCQLTLNNGVKNREEGGRGINGCLLYSIVKLHLILFKLLFIMFLVRFCIIFHCNVSYISKFIFVKRSVTNYLYITSFVDDVYSTYILHILLL